MGCSMPRVHWLKKDISCILSLHSTDFVKKIYNDQKNTKDMDTVRKGSTSLWVHKKEVCPRIVHIYYLLFMKANK